MFQFGNFFKKSSVPISSQQIVLNSSIPLIYIPEIASSITAILKSLSLASYIDVRGQFGKLHPTIGECLKLKPSDLEDGEPYRIKIRGEYSKSGNSRITFISKEAVLFLNEWLKVRQDYLKSAIGNSHLYAKNKEDDRIFPFELQTAYFIWKNALLKSGYMKKDSSTNRLTVHPHVLRKFFRTRLGSIIPVDIVETLIGHEGYLTEVYRKYTFEDLGKFYQQGEHTLTVFGSGEDVNKLREEIS